MSADQSLTVATNAMCVIAFCAPQAVSAAFIAEQISLHPVVVRRALGKLVKANLVISTQGASGGYMLAGPAAGITIQNIYDALSSKGIFARSNAGLHANCSEGKVISDVLAAIFGQAEDAFADVLRKITLADVLQRGSGVHA
jgi:Rrf2 family protein